MYDRPLYSKALRYPCSILDFCLKVKIRQKYYIDFTVEGWFYEWKSSKNQNVFLDKCQFNLNFTKKDSVGVSQQLELWSCNLRVGCSKLCIMFAHLGSIVVTTAFKTTEAKPIAWTWIWMAKRPGATSDNGFIFKEINKDLYIKEKK